MRFLALLLSLALLPDLSEAATKVPKRDFTLSVTVSNDDLETFTSENLDFLTLDVISENDHPWLEYSYFFFDTRSDDSWNEYKIVGTVLEGQFRYGEFTYNFATKSGSVYRFTDSFEEVYFSFTAGKSADYSYINDDDPTTLYETASWSDATVTLTLAPVPLPAGLPLLAAGLCCLGLWRKKGA